MSGAPDRADRRKARVMTHSVNTPWAGELREQLARWTAAGLIDAAQASRIEEAEAARAGTGDAAQGPAPPAAAAGARRRLPLAVEALGYLGAVIAIAAGIVAVQQYWPHIPASAELAFAGAAAVLLLAAGAVVKTGGEPAFTRLRSALWLLGTASAASFAALLAGRFGHMSDADTALLGSLAWTACAIPLWWRERSALLHLSMFGGLVALAESGIARFVTDPPLWEFGLVLWVMSAVWGAAAWRKYITPETAGLAASGAGVLAGASLAMDTAAGVVLALATVAGLLAAGVILRRVLLLALGAAGVIWVVPHAVSRYLAGSAAAPFAVAMAGLVLAAIAVWLARTRTRS
jgi:Predicted membrane protein (DUF2157)